jgi:hypothetical protein
VLRTAQYGHKIDTPAEDATERNRTRLSPTVCHVFAKDVIEKGVRIVWVHLPDGPAPLRMGKPKTWRKGDVDAAALVVGFRGARPKTMVSADQGVCAPPEPTCTARRGTGAQSNIPYWLGGHTTQGTVQNPVWRAGHADTPHGTVQHPVLEDTPHKAQSGIPYCLDRLF